MRGQDRSARIARLANCSRGVVSRSELRRIGLSSAAIDRRIANGSLQVEFPGVYRVGHRAPDPLARFLAAVKACGTGAVLSGRAGAWLWGLIKGPRPPPEVSIATERRIPQLKTR